MTNNPSPDALAELLPTLERAAKRNQGSRLTPDDVKAVLTLTTELAQAKAAFHFVDRLLCAAIQDGFYCGEGVLNDLAMHRNALTKEPSHSIGGEDRHGGTARAA